MAEYIEREARLEHIAGLSIIITGLSRGRNQLAEFGIRYKNSILQGINDFPAADVAPVRHGRWIEPSRLYYGAKQYECSLCYSDTFWKKHSITEKYPHCPNCGCRMDGGDDE